MSKLTELVGIEEIKVMLVPNTADKTPIELTKDVIYHPLMANIQGALSKNPFITGEVVYDKNFLYQLPYDKRVRFFFDKNKFREYILGEMSITSTADPGDAESTNENINTNVDIMLKALFPTIYPASGNNIKSFENIIQGKSQNMFSSVFSTTINYVLPNALRFLSPSLAVFYSYIKVGGQIHTVTRTVWLNDFINHPQYRDLLTGYGTFMKWQAKTGETIDSEIDQYLNRIAKIIKSKFIGIGTERFIKGTDITETTTTATQTIHKHTLCTIKDISNISEDLQKSLIKLANLLRGSPGGFSKIGETNDMINEIGNRIGELLTAYTSYTSNTTDKTIKKNFINAIVELDESLKKNAKLGNNSVTVPVELSRDLNSITSISVRINSLIIIKEKYFGDSISTDFSLDTKEVEQEMSSKFGEYKTFVDKVKILVKPNYTTTNPELEEIMKKYTEGEPSKTKIIKTNGPADFSNILGYINDTFIKKKMTHKAFIHKTFANGTTESALEDLIRVDTMYMDRPGKDPKYSIYVAVDLIKGELNDANKTLIKCEYYGEKVGSLFDRAKHAPRYNKYELYQPRMFDLEKDGHVTKDGTKAAASGPGPGPIPVDKDKKNPELSNMLNPIDAVDPLGVGLLNKNPVVKGGKKTRKNKHKHKHKRRTRRP